MMFFLALGLYLVGYVAIVVEFFVPAGGLVGLAGAGSIVGAIVIIFINYGKLLGYIFLVIAVVATPILVLLYFKVFPKSFLGRRLILAKRQDREDGFIAHSPNGYEELVGKRGKSLTPLRPAGTVLIDGKRYSVVTGGEFIGKGEAIEVHRVEGSRIEVRKRKE